uniref:Uncharacterized protein n=1 Tax=Rhizophora mucronata TaxID=61149 RepID=A0A2P2P718_RHIMU
MILTTIQVYRQSRVECLAICCQL